jgi:hypothetical protein
MARVWKLLKLPAAEQWLLAQALLLLPVNRLSLRLLGFNRWSGILANWAPGTEHPTSSGPLAEAANATIAAQSRQTAKIVNWASCYGIFGGNCLQRSLTLWWILRRQGINSGLKIGARLNHGQIEAHAWVECFGAVLNDGEDVASRFPPFNRVFIPAKMNIR